MELGDGLQTKTNWLPPRAGCVTIPCVFRGSGVDAADPRLKFATTTAPGDHDITSWKTFAVVVKSPAPMITRSPRSAPSWTVEVSETFALVFEFPAMRRLYAPAPFWTLDPFE